MIHKYLINLKIKPEQVTMAMKLCYIDILTVILKSEIKLKGISYIKHVIAKACPLTEKENTKWTSFWSYFKK